MVVVDRGRRGEEGARGVEGSEGALRGVMQAGHYHLSGCVQNMDGRVGGQKF